MKAVCIHGYISGKVQGVWFRDSTRQQAEKLGITGWAKNLSDGRVEVLLYGSPENIELMREWLHRGPPLAQVSSVDIAEKNINEVPIGFQVLY